MFRWERSHTKPPRSHSADCWPSVFMCVFLCVCVAASQWHNQSPPPRGWDRLVLTCDAAAWTFHLLSFFSPAEYSTIVVKAARVWIVSRRRREAPHVDFSPLRLMTRPRNPVSEVKNGRRGEGGAGLSGGSHARPDSPKHIWASTERHWEKNCENSSHLT